MVSAICFVCSPTLWRLLWCYIMGFKSESARQHHHIIRIVSYICWKHTHVFGWQLRSSIWLLGSVCGDAEPIRVKVTSKTLKTLRYWLFFIFKFKITPKPLGVSMSYCIIRCFSCFSLITLKREKFRNSFCLWSSRVEYSDHFPLKFFSVAHISVKIW